jgi:hypothetical protein
MSARVELWHPSERGDGMRYEPVLIDDVFPGGIQLGLVESYTERADVMHTTPGWQNVARKRSYRKRWLARTRGQGEKQTFSTRWEAIAHLLRIQDGSLSGIETIAKGAKVVG